MKIQSTGIENCLAEINKNLQRIYLELKRFNDPSPTLSIAEKDNTKNAPRTKKVVKDRKSMAKFHWTEEEDKRLVELRRLGLNYEEIARKMKPRTRSSCNSRMRYLEFKELV